jgi:predicted HTH domain antitoxin
VEAMKKEQMVGTRLPQHLVGDLRRIEEVEQSDRSTVMRKLLATAVADWKLEHYAKLYGERKITLARAAREAGVSLWEMIDYTRRKKIPSQYDLDDFEDDLKAIRSRLASR